MLDPEEVESIRLTLQAAAYVVSIYPLIVTLTWFGRQFVAWYDEPDSREVAADA